MKDQDICDVILANGKDEAIQVYQAGEWIDVKNGNYASTTSWLISCIARGTEYRVKPKAREFWINVYSRGPGTAYDSKESADIGAGSGSNRTSCIHVVEQV